MAITTQAQLQAALEGGQPVNYRCSNTVPGSNNWGDHFAFSTIPPGGTLAGTSTTAGVVPTDATTGCPPINNFPGGVTGYLGAVAVSPTFNVQGGGRVRISDMLWKAGAYAFNANVTLASQPSYSGRIPNGDYKGTELWIDTTTAFVGTPTITITYTNQDGVTGQSTGAVVMPAAFPVNRMYQMPLQAGDTGVQKVESVVCTVATGGAFNVMVLRPLWMGRIAHGGNEEFQGPDKTDLPIVFDSSALLFQSAADYNNNSNLSFDLIATVIYG
jgi:hypothetical protein